MQTPHKTQSNLPGDTDSSFAGFSDNSGDPGNPGDIVFWGTGESKPATKGGGGDSGSGTSGSGSSSGSSSPPPTGFTINVTWDDAGAPAGFQTAAMAAVTYLESQFHDPVTLNITLGYGNLGTGILGESDWGMESFSYASVLAAMKAHDTTANDATAIASLPASSSETVYMTPANAQALGLIASGGSDGAAWVNSDYNYTYNDASGVAGGTYDLEGIMLHEITEVMGRDLIASATDPSLLGLFDYKSAGVRDTSDFSGYFSINGGTTDLAPFNTNSAGDPGDWGAVSDNALDAAVPAGARLNFSSADVTVMDALGYEANPYQPPAPTGVSMAPSPGTLASAMSATGLNPSVALASFTEAGGVSGDTYSYTLSGTDAASFTLSGNKLMAAGTGVTGAVNGQLFSLDVSATDTSGAGSAASPADPLDLIVGSSGSDIIQVGSLASHSTPTLIYGLGGGDTINGTGMTSSLWFAAGPGGGDTLTGGSGANRYMFCSANDSPATAMDGVTNFHAGTDLLDFSGIRYSAEGSRKPHRHDHQCRFSGLAAERGRHVRLCEHRLGFREPQRSQHGDRTSGHHCASFQELRSVTSELAQKYPERSRPRPGPHRPCEPWPDAFWPCAG